MIASAIRVAAALLGVAATSLAQAEDEPTVVVRSLLPFAAPSLQLAAGLETALPDERRSSSPGLEAAVEPLSPAWVLTLLQQRHRSAIDDGRLRVTMASQAVVENGQTVGKRSLPTLILQGRAADVAACNRELDAIAHAIGRPIEVTAFRLPLDDGELPATTWSAATLQQALQRTPPLWTTRGHTRSGGALRLAQEGGIGHLRDLDVEVASAASITDPKVDVAFTGARATLTAHALPGDQLLLSGSWLLSEPVALHEQSIGLGAGSVDLPEHRTAWATFAGRIPSGGALVVAGRGGPVGPAGFVLVVAARYLSPPAGDVAPDLLVRAITALLQGPAAGRPQLGWRRPGEDHEAFPTGGFDGGLGGGLGAADLLEVFAARPPAEVDCQAGVLLVSGDVNACRTADSLLQQLFARLRPAAFSCAVAGGGSPALELTQPILCERAAAAFVGRERALLRDHEVEIAEKAQMANPVIGIARSGLWFGATTSADAGSGHHVTGRWSLAAHDEPRVRQHAEKKPMTMQLVDYRTTTLPWDATMTPNVEHTLGNGPAWTANGTAPLVRLRLITP